MRRLLRTLMPLTTLALSACGEVGDVEIDPATAGDPPPPAEEVSTVVPQALMAQQTLICGDPPRTCTASELATEPDVQHAGVIARVAVRSAAFLECMDRTMRTGIPYTSTHVTTAPTIMSCDNVTTYPVNSWGPYVSCRPEKDAFVGGDTGDSRGNHDGAWNELLHRQIARVFTVLQSDVRVENRYRFGAPAGAQQRGYSNRTSAIWWSGGVARDLFGNHGMIGENGDDSGILSTQVHEVLHNYGYDHGCFPSSGMDHGNCGRSIVEWRPSRSMNNIAAFCAKEVIRRSVETPACRVDPAAPSELRRCANGGRMVVSKFTNSKTDAQTCHCVPDTRALDVAGFGDNNNGGRFGGSVAVADFNGDGNQDLAVGAPIGGDNSLTGVFLFRGSSQGLRPWRSFRPADLQLGTSTNPRCGAAVAAGDFNKDGVVDLAVGCPGASASTGRVVVLRGCKGTSCPGHLAGGAGPSQDGPQPTLIQVLTPSTARGASKEFGSALATGDFNNDTITDLVVGAPQALVGTVATGVVEVFRGNTTGNLVSTLSTIIPTNIQANHKFGAALALGNIHAAGAKELVVGAPGADAGLGRVYVVRGPLGTAAGDVVRLSTSGLATNTGVGHSVATGNLAGDAFEEVVAGAPNVGKIYLAMGGTGAAGPLHLSITGGTGAGSSLAVDRRAGRPDLLVGAAAARKATRYTYNVDFGPLGVATYDEQLWTARHTIDNGHTANCAAWNNIDFDTPCPWDAQNLVSNASAFGAVVAVGSFGQGNQIVIGAPSDLNLNGLFGGSVYVREGSATAQEYRVDRVSIWYGGSPELPRRFADGTQWSQQACGPGQECRLADWDKDGDKDLIIFFKNSFTDGRRGDVLVALARSTGVFDPPIKRHDFFCVDDEICDVGDFNGDGFADIVLFGRATAGNVYVGIGNGTGDFVASLWRTGFCQHQQVCAVGDISGDAASDLVAFHKGTTADVFISKSNAVGGFNAVEKWSDFFCPGTEVCQLADVDGDGDDDLVAFKNDSSGDVYVSENNRARFDQWNQKWHTNFCTAGQVCKLADVNNDKKADAIAFVRNSNTAERGWVYAALSNGRDFGPPEVWNKWFCIDNEVCMAGDITKDGRADLVGVNPGTRVAFGAISGR